jgi:aminoglycoside phosphotransferase (APT) family kinase protein
MPTPVARDQAQALQMLETWVASRISPDARVVGDLVVPQGQGNANETMLFTVAHGGIEERLVLRIAATAFQVFLESSLTEQYRVLDALGSKSSLPVPTVRWFEEDESYFGAEFLVMDAVDGQVPPDQPSYNCDGTWTAALTTDQRRHLWGSSVDALCSIHSDPGVVAAEEVLAAKLHGRSGLAEQIEYWTTFTQWAGGGSPILDDALTWLTANLPGNPKTGLSWGDARLENMMFDQNLDCVAVLDWEMASLGGPLLDLGWWLFCDRFAEIAYDTRRLEGFGDRAATCERWVARTGVPIDDLDWYEIFAGYRMSTIIMRMMRKWRDDFGLELPENFNDVDNAASRLLTELLAAASGTHR